MKFLDFCFVYIIIFVCFAYAQKIEHLNHLAKFWKLKTPTISVWYQLKVLFLNEFCASLSYKKDDVLINVNRKESIRSDAFMLRAKLLLSLFISCHFMHVCALIPTAVFGVDWRVHLVKNICTDTVRVQSGDKECFTKIYFADCAIYCVVIRTLIWKFTMVQRLLCYLRK